MMMHVDLNDDVPYIHQINGQEFVVMSKKRYMELVKSEMERDIYKPLIEKLGSKGEQ